MKATYLADIPLAIGHMAYFSRKCGLGLRPEIQSLSAREWFFWTTHSRLQPMREAAYTIKRHWDGVLRWFTSHINAGVLEGINGLVQAAKARGEAIERLGT